MTLDKLREEIWFISQEVRLGNLSEIEAVNQIDKAYKEAGYIQQADDQSFSEQFYNDWGGESGKDMLKNMLKPKNGTVWMKVKLEVKDELL